MVLTNREFLHKEIREAEERLGNDEFRQEYLEGCIYGWKRALHMLTHLEDKCYDTDEESSKVCSVNEHSVPRYWGDTYVPRWKWDGQEIVPILPDEE